MKPAANRERDSTKRKENVAPPDPSDRLRKKPNPQQDEQSPTENPTLIGPHESIISTLTPKYNVLPASVISSTQIQKRIILVTDHLRKSPPTGSSDASPVVLLHARPRESCKLITIVEQCKRLLKKEGISCYQYNQLFTLPAEVKKPDIVEATVLPGDKSKEDDDDDDDDGFEVMESRFEKAIQPPPNNRVSKSLRIFLATTAVPELKAIHGVSLQASN